MLLTNLRISLITKFSQSDIRNPLSLLAHNQITGVYLRKKVCSVLTGI